MNDNEFCIITSNIINFGVMCHSSYFPQKLFKAFTPLFLKTVLFEIAFTRDDFGAALHIIDQLQSGALKKIPQNAPAGFITQSWHKLIFAGATLHAKAYELSVLAVLKDRLLSGDVFVSLSRKFADFNSFLIPKKRWHQSADVICQALGGLNIGARIDERVTQLSDLLEPLSVLLAKGTEIRLEEGALIVPQLEGEEVPPSVKLLQEQINQRLPQVGLVEIIREVDAWVQYSEEFTESVTFRNSEHFSLRYAALMGNACNLSLADLARSSDLDYQSLWWVASNYFSDENLKRANDRLVNFHHKQSIASHWGDGTLSSSDGQRFPTSGKIRNAQALPKYFGYGKGVTFYTYTSDQYSQYGTKVISATERDATYVLDEIMANETDLNILEYTTDTHGYTDLLFAFFDLVDKWFAPRLRDIKNQKLCKVKLTGSDGTSWEYPELKFTGTVNIAYLKNNADELRRVAASLQTGTVTASLLISKLQSYPRQNNLMYVLQAYGQLIKTIFICRYLLELPLRHKINAQLNKGEQLHNLRTYLWFGGD